MLLTAKRMFTGRGSDVLEDRVLDIDGGRITDVRARGSVPSDAEVVDLGDATLLPGLIDVHQHLAFDASPDPVARLATDDDLALLLRMRLAAQQALGAGITTIRDLGDRSYLSLALRDWFLAGNEVGPRILASGPPITIEQGHCWFLGGEIGPGGIREAVRERVERGVDVIKVMASGGNLTPTVGPHESQLGYDELVAAREEAHAAGLPLAVHAHGAQAVADAIAARVDSIEHCTFFTADGVEADATVLAQLAASGCVVSMTAANVPGSADAIHPAIQQRLSAIVANHGTLYRNGALVVCSSDAGVGPSKPHTVLPHGVSTFLPSIGMSNAEAIINVTAFAAQVCGIADRTGTLEPGKDADVIAVAGNPLDDIDAIHDIVAVFARGQRLCAPDVA